MKRFPSHNLLVLQALFCLLPRVVAYRSLSSSSSLLAEDGPAAANARVTETLQVARQLRQSNRQLLTCEDSLPAIQEALGDGSLTSCQCLEIDGTASSIVNCQDYCRLCRDDLNLCVTYEYAFNFVQGNLNTFLGRLEYSGARSDVLEFQETYEGNGQDLISCATSVNNVPCNSCVPSSSGCADGVNYDCSNIEGGAIFDECTGDFENIAVTSVFAAYNINFFNDADCIFFPTISPAPTQTPLPTRQPQMDPNNGPGTTISPTRPPLITRTLNTFWIGVEYTTLDDVEFSQTIIDYLTIQLSLFFPELGGVVLNRIEPVGPIPPDEVMFEFDGEAIFLDRAPNLLALEAAQRYILQNLIALQQAITSNPNVGEDVFVVVVLISPDTLAPTPAPSPRPTKGYYNPPPWGFRPSMSMKSKGKGSKGKGSKGKGYKGSKGKKGMMKSSMSGKKMGKSNKHGVAPSPTYYYGHQHPHDPQGHHQHPYQPYNPWYQNSPSNHFEAPTQHHPVPSPTPPTMQQHHHHHHHHQTAGPNNSYRTGTWVMKHKSEMSGTWWKNNNGMVMSGSFLSGGRWSPTKTTNNNNHHYAPTWQMRHKNSNNGYMSWSMYHQNSNGPSGQMGMYTRWKYSYNNMTGKKSYKYKGSKKMGKSKKMRKGYW